MQLSRTLDRLLPAVALATFALLLLATLAVAGDTLGYDFRAYHAAASRVLGGQPAYDTSFDAAGGFGLFYYPPTFIPIVLPLGLLQVWPATWSWIALLVAAFLVGVAAMPVNATVKWLVVLLAALSWPFLYAVKLGQVGPLLFLLFAVGWRWMDRPLALGVSGALGTAIKLQPGLILAWAVLTRRWRAAVGGAVVLLGIALAGTLFAGPGAWSDFAGLMGRVSDPITTAHNFTPGAVAYQAGVDRNTALLVQGTTTLAIGLLVVVAALWWPADASYLVAVIASQLLSPILWDHYAMLLLLPVAWLLNRGAWWAAAIPLATSVLLVGVIPPVVYPLAFWITAIIVLAAGWRGRPRTVLAYP